MDKELPWQWKGQARPHRFEETASLANPPSCPRRATKVMKSWERRSHRHSQLWPYIYIYNYPLEIPYVFLIAGGHHEWDSHATWTKSLPTDLSAACLKHDHPSAATGDTVSKRQQQGQQQQQQQQPQPQNYNQFDDVLNDSLPVSIIPNCVNDSFSVIYSATRLAKNRLARWLDIFFTCIIIYLFPRRFQVTRLHAQIFGQLGMGQYL